MAIEYYRAHFTGTSCAKCWKCGATWAYWDEDDDIENHECVTKKKTKRVKPQGDWSAWSDIMSV